MRNIKIGDTYYLNENKKQIVSRKEENGYNDQYFEKEEIKWVVLDKNKETRRIITNK